MQMPRLQSKNIINNSHDDMPLLEPSSLTTVFPEHCNIAEAQEKGLKIAFKNMIEVLTEEMNTLLREISETHTAGDE